MIKKIWNWFVEIIKETLNLSWTLVGLVIATLTLTGSAQQITGLATIITLAIWLLTIGFRKDKDNSKGKVRRWFVDYVLEVVLLAQ